jgi:F-type H+-transporting ATPase subunit b
MEGGLGIDWKILLLQIVNFLVLLWLLKRFVYKPFLGILAKRQKQIEEGVKKSRQAEESLANIRQLAQEVKVSQEKRSKEIIAAAENKAKERAKTILVETETDQKKIIEDARKTIEHERRAAREGQKREAAELAVAIAQEVLQSKLDAQEDKKLVERLISRID